MQSKPASDRSPSLGPKPEPKPLPKSDKPQKYTTLETAINQGLIDKNSKEYAAILKEYNDQTMNHKVMAEQVRLAPTFWSHRGAPVPRAVADAVRPSIIHRPSIVHRSRPMHVNFPSM